MLRTLSAGLFALILLGSAAAPAEAQSACGERTEILAALESAHGEAPRAIGRSTNGGLLEVLVSPSGGWTILVTTPNGPTCILASGESWESNLTISGQAV